MNLKTKLCNDYILLPESMRTYLEKACAESWMAGFETGREMAHKFATDQGADYGRCWDSDEILKLGEEEVND